MARKPVERRWRALAAVVAAVVGGALAGPPAGAQTTTTAATPATTAPVPVLESACADPAVDGIAGVAGPTNANASLDLRSAKISVDKKGNWVWSALTRGPIGADPGSYELSVYKVNKKMPDQVTGLAFAVRADTRNTAAPVQARRGEATALTPVKAKATATAADTTLTVTIPAKAKLALPSRFAWSVSAVNDDPNTATRYEDRCPSKPSAAGAVAVNVLVPATPTSQAVVDQAFASSQLDADKARIVAYWNVRNDAWKAGFTTGVQNVVDTSYPPFNEPGNVNFETCRKYYAGVNGRLLTFSLDLNTIRPQPGWVAQSVGQVPNGRIYIMNVTQTVGGTAATVSTTTLEAHVTVSDDGTANGFAICTR